MTRSTNPFRPRLEKEEQRAIVRLLKTGGFVVSSTSQYRASRVAGGLPDLIVTGRGIGFFWETKKYRRTPTYHPQRPETWEPEPLRSDQMGFRARCLGAGWRHGWGGIRELMAALVEWEVAEWVSAFGGPPVTIRWRKQGGDVHA